MSLQILKHKKKPFLGLSNLLSIMCPIQTKSFVYFLLPMNIAILIIASDSTVTYTVSVASSIVAFSKHKLNNERFKTSE